MRASMAVREHGLQITQPKRDTTGCRFKAIVSVILCNMHKYCAPTALNAWAMVVAKHNDNIVKPVIAAKLFCTCGIRMSDQAVVVCITRRVAPAVRWLDRAHTVAPCQCRPE